MPLGADPGRRFRRIGIVQARRLDVRQRWASHAGDLLHGEPGDWLVTSADGTRRTVKDAQFRTLYDHVSGATWRRVGEVKAVRVTSPTRVATLEGTAMARPGDWVVTGPDGDTWPVSAQFFRINYAPTVDDPGAEESEDEGNDGSPATHES